MSDKTIMLICVILIDAEVLLNPLPFFMRLISKFPKMALKERFLMKRVTQPFNDAQTTLTMQQLIRRHSLTALSCIKYLLSLKNESFFNLISTFTTDINRMVSKSVLGVVKISESGTLTWTKITISEKTPASISESDGLLLSYSRKKRTIALTQPFMATRICVITFSTIVLIALVVSF